MKRQKLSERILPKYTHSEEIFNMTTHIVGGAVGICALVLCLIAAAIHHDGFALASSIVYGISMIILYTMSSIYHGLPSEKMSKKVFQVIDHCSIFLLIAGTYTPITLCTLRRQNVALGWIVFGIIWVAAVLGIVLNSIDIKAFRKFSAVCYLVMGWCIIFAWKPTSVSLGNGGISLILGGGIMYTIGAVFYYFLKKKKFMHSIFHIFVLFGSIMHTLCILLYVV